MSLDQMPAEIVPKISELTTKLDTEISAKKPGENLLIATWNIRGFGSLTRKWFASGNDSPKRDWWGLRIIMEIISRFDVIAIQELKGDLRALRDLVKALGPDWGFLMTDITLGDAGNKERLGFIYDSRRVTPSGLAAELVIPEEWMNNPDIAAGALQRQFARTPYAVSFRAGKQTFILVTMHVIYGEDTANREKELEAIAHWMKSWANRTNRWHQNLIVLGDFNIDRKDDELWKAFTSTGLKAPRDIENAPKTIFNKSGKPENDKHYDQVAWFTTGNREKLNMKYIKGDIFKFEDASYQGKGLSKTSLSWRVSDHYPLWTEFEL